MAQVWSRLERKIRPLKKRMVFLVAFELLILAAVLAFSAAAFPQVTPGCEAQPEASDCKTVQVAGAYHDGWTEEIPGWTEEFPGHWEQIPGHWEHIPGWWDHHPGYWDHHPDQTIHHGGSWSYDPGGCDDDGNCWDSSWTWNDGWDEFVQGWDEWHWDWGEWHDPQDVWQGPQQVWHDPQEVWHDPQEVWHPPYDDPPTETVVCKCDGTCPSGQRLNCSGGAGNECGPGTTCTCDQLPPKDCNTAAECGGPVQCPNTQQAGSSWMCNSAGQCVSYCGNDSGAPPPPLPPSGAATPPTTGPGTPATTPGAGTPTATRFPSPTPILPYGCPTNPESLGGSVKQIIPPPVPNVQMAFQPNYPVVVGQDPTQRGVDADVALTVGPCTIIWHYKVKEEYEFCPTKNNCELRWRWKEWDETCQESYALRQVKIDSTLNPASVAYINGPLAQKYPGARIYQGELVLFPSPLAHVVNYTVGKPTTWEMRGLKYPHADPGFWDVTTTIVTENSGHCAPLSWTIPTPNAFRVYLRDERLTK